MAKAPKARGSGKPRWIVKAIGWEVVRIENGKEKTVAAEETRAKAVKTRKQMKREWGE